MSTQKAPEKFPSYAWSRFRIWAGGFIRDAKPLPQRYPQYRIGRGCYGPLEIETFGDGVAVSIGAFCSFAKGCVVLLGGEHRPEWVTTYPFDRKYFHDATLPHSSFAKGNVEIGNDVWFGRDVLVLSGAKIGNGAIIGSRSMVRGEIPPYSICAGTPAKVLKYRFTPEEIEKLQKIEWWNWPDEKIQANGAGLLDADLDGFLSEHSK